MAESRWLTSSHARAETEARDRVAPSSFSVRRAPALSLAPRHRRRSRLDLHYLLEGGGWVTVRLAVDLLAALMAVALSTVLVGGAPAERLSQSSVLGFPLLVATMLCIRGMYRSRVREVLLDLVGPILGAVSVAAMIVLAWEVLILGDASVSAEVAAAWLLGGVFVGGGRAALTLVKRSARARMHVGRSTLIVGAGAVGAQIVRRIDEHPEYGLRPIGYLDADPPEAVVGDRHVPVLGAPQDLERVVMQTRAEHVILAFSLASDRALVPLVRRCDELGLEVSLIPRLFESVNDRVQLEHLGGLPLLGLRAVDPKGWQFQIKYALDRPIAATLLALVSPVMLLATLAVKLSSPGPILYRQRRVGRDGTVFHLLKFRSMHVVSRSARRFQPDDGRAPGGVEGVDRRTLVGRLLRRTAVDELPQLINVLRGDMSLVGPRPERPEYVELFELDHYRYADRHRVKSGLTGWAQVHGLRGQTSLADRVEWDNAYIENWSLWLDFKILLMTAGAILRSGADA